MMTFARPQRPWDRTPAANREYFAILGPGLVVVLPPRKPGRSNSSEWQPPTGGAWIHVGTDGRVRGFSGKAEVGQGTRTALALVVADELRVPLDRVDVVMADTDLCPWDMGTFGSRSMPDAAPALGAAAAGAREVLARIAAERLGRSRSDLEAIEGEIRIRGESRGVPYGELVQGQNRMESIGPGTPLTPPSQWQRAGRPLIDPGASDVVTGRRVYSSDLQRPGMLHGVVLRAPAYGATLAEVDLEAARKIPGAVIVREGDFVGVATATASEAGAVLEVIRATWHPTPQPGEAEIEAYLRSHPQEGDAWDADERILGDADRALASAPVSLEMTYRSAYIAHVPLETHCAIAEWEGARVTVWVGTQTPFRVRDELAKAFSMPVEDVRVIVPPTGSGFGGKHGGEISLAAARLAQGAQRPVRLAYTREEEFRWGYLRPTAIIDVRVGAEKDGKLLAWVFHNVNAGSAALFPPYRIPHQKVDNELSHSPLPQGSYRSLAAAGNNFARESAIDELAHRVGVDPMTLRERNLEDDRLRAVLRRAADKAGWLERRHIPGKGYGLALGLEKGSRVATVAEVRVEANRFLKVDRLITAFEAGAIVNPDNLRSQVEGAMVMGLGGALFEAVHFDAGSLQNPHLSQYRVPRFSDLPKMEVELIDRKDLAPTGAGETPLIAVAPALANAIFDATGCRLRALPLVPSGQVPDQNAI
jgi:nicotinate dehydrogenase subunit B